MEELALSIRPEVKYWFEEAKEDLKHAVNSIKMGDYSWSCFAAQQAVEKAFKALIINTLRKRPLHVHDLTALYNDVRGRLNLSEEAAAGLAELSSYYVIARYPNAGLTRPSVSITKFQAEKAVALARKVVGDVGKIIRHTGKR